MADSGALGAVRLRGLTTVAIMGWMRVVDTISLRDLGGREADRSGRNGDGGSRGLVTGRGIVGKSDSSTSRYVESRGGIR